MAAGALFAGAGTATAAPSQTINSLPRCYGNLTMSLITYGGRAVGAISSTSCATPVYKIKVRSWLEEASKDISGNITGWGLKDYDESSDYHATFSGTAFTKDFCAWGFGIQYRLRSKHTIRVTPEQKTVFWTTSPAYPC